MHTIELEIEIENEPVNVEVDFNFWPGEPMVWILPNGDPGHPGSGPEVEITSIKDESGKELLNMNITDKMFDFIHQRCFNYIESL